MRSKAELIVLNHTKFGENSIVLHTLSGEYGRRGFLVRAGRGAGMALFLPLNILEAEVTENPKSELWHARNFSGITPLEGIRSDMRKNTMTLFMSEVIYRVVKDRTGDEALFEWLKGEILTLDALESDFLNFHLLFLLDLCTALGFAPETEYLAPFAGDHLRQVGSLLSLPFEEALLLPMSGADRNEIAGSILRYIEHHTESAVNVRSLAVLREIYA